MKKRVVSILLALVLLSALLPGLTGTVFAEEKTVTGLEIPDITIIEGTCGGWVFDYNNLLLDWWFSMGEALDAKCVVHYSDGSTKVLSKEDIDIIYGSENWSFSWYYHDTWRFDQFEVGKAYQISAYYYEYGTSAECQFQLYIEPSPVTKVDIADCIAWQIPEGLPLSEGGAWISDEWVMDEFAYYDEDSDDWILSPFLCYLGTPNEVTVHFNDGTVLSSQNDLYCDKMSTMLSAKIGLDKPFVTYFAPQTSSAPWGLGKHTAYFGILGKVYEYQVNVIENPVDHITCEDVTIPEHTHGSFGTGYSYYDEELGKEVYVDNTDVFYYNRNDILKLTVYLKDGSSVTGSVDEIEAALGRRPYIDCDTLELGKNQCTIYFGGFSTEANIIIERGSSTFNDVASSAWYYDAVNYAVEHKLMNGVGNNSFAPDSPMTRAMLVTVLWRYEGEPQEGKNAFTDVPNGQWYTKAVAWAASKGIVGGIGNNRFDPNGNITREQMAAILYRYAQGKGFDTSKRGDLSGFPDRGKVSSWATDAIKWAVAEKIIGGSDGKLLPQGNATRAQVSTILMRFIEGIAKK